MQPRHPANDPVTCGFAQERFELYLDGALQGPDLYALQRHLRDCDRCADFVAEDVAAADALLITLAPLAESAPATVRDGRPITHHSGEIIFVRRRPLVWALGLTAAAGLVVAFSLVPVAFDPGVSPSSALAAQDPVSPDELLGYSPAGAASDHASTSSSVAVSPVDLEPRISDDAQLEGAALLVGRHGEGWPYRSVSVLD
ncbi:MAG: zf-HC2 domain-containing protein, partial [Salinibacterium sp.]|nr:zf-HC2 domain-containing protein [Salinibacterium sp.]